jgi:SAM-dependent methyltransferase
MDYSAPAIARFAWPKTFPPLAPEQIAISDDFMRRWHEELPAKYGIIDKVNHAYPLRTMKPGVTVEIGAGLGEHLEFEDLAGQDYTCVEMRENMAAKIRARFPSVKTVVGDCQARLPFEDASVDRFIAIHVLEHLPNLPAALDEARRILAPGGTMSVVIPCDPGLAYEVARKISAERLFRKWYRIPYGWLIRREHINSPAEIIGELKRRFTIKHQMHWPLIVPIVNANLIIGLTLRRPANG